MEGCGGVMEGCVGGHYLVEHNCYAVGHVGDLALNQVEHAAGGTDNKMDWAISSFGGRHTGGRNVIRTRHTSLRKAQNVIAKLCASRRHNHLVSEQHTFK
jgi:hypothetical protein